MTCKQSSNQAGVSYTAYSGPLALEIPRTDSGLGTTKGRAPELRSEPLSLRLAVPTKTLKGGQPDTIKPHTIMVMIKVLDGDWEWGLVPPGMWHVACGMVYSSASKYTLQHAIGPMAWQAPPC